tara:strand:- start:121 stop:273 length:153 start_codon:yes stop_codon:yes gene_type:complete
LASSVYITKGKAKSDSLRKPDEILLLFMTMPLAMLGTFIGCFAIATLINF